MEKKIKYGLSILLIIVLGLLAYLFILNNKLSQKEPVKTENVPVPLTQEQLIEKIRLEQKVKDEEIAAKIQQAKDDVARKVQEAAEKKAQADALLLMAASSTKNTSTEPVK